MFPYLMIKEIEHHDGSDEKVTKALSKMAERHQKTLAKWEARREAIIEEQRNNWLSVLKAVTEVVEQKPSTAPESAADSFKIQTYSDYVKQKLENGQLSELFNPGNYYYYYFSFYLFKNILCKNNFLNLVNLTLSILEDTFLFLLHTKNQI